MTKTKLGTGIKKDKKNYLLCKRGYRIGSDTPCSQCAEFNIEHDGCGLAMAARLAVGKANTIINKGVKQMNKEETMRTYQIYEHNKPIPKNTARLGRAVRATIQASSGKEAAMHYLKSPVKRSSWEDVFEKKDVISVCPEKGNCSNWLKESDK